MKLDVTNAVQMKSTTATFCGESATNGVVDDDDKKLCFDSAKIGLKTFGHIVEYFNDFVL